MIQPAKLVDILAVLANPRPLDAVAINSFARDRDTDVIAAGLFSSSSVIYSQFDEDGYVVGVCGAIEKWDGCFYLWAFATQYAQRLAMAKEWLRFLRRFTDALMEEGARRIECTVIDGFEFAEKTVRSLGFEHEGIERNAGREGESRHYYARIAK